MASLVAEQKIKSGYKIEVWDHDPATASALVTSPDGGTTDRYMDGRDLSHFAVIVAATVFGGNGPTLVEIVAADDAAGTNITQIKTSGTIAADALGDWVIEECSMDEVSQISAAAGLNLRYVAARITCHHSGDEALVTYLGIPRRSFLNQTPATTIA